MLHWGFPYKVSTFIIDRQPPATGAESLPTTERMCLSDDLLRDRNELFNLWLENDEDFAKVELHYQRVRTKQDSLAVAYERFEVKLIYR